MAELADREMRFYTAIKTWQIKKFERWNQLVKLSHKETSFLDKIDGEIIREINGREQVIGALSLLLSSILCLSVHKHLKEVNTNVKILLYFGYSVIPYKFTRQLYEQNSSLKTIICLKYKSQLINK